jgi:nucleoside-diphosphate-sugar epimerase
MMKIAVVGATGPSVRVIARSADRLARLFPEAAVEKQSVDVLDADATLRAIEGCDLVYDCIGLPGDQMHLHPVTARNIAGALRHTKARCVQVSSYWAYYPQVRTEINESHPRIGEHGLATTVVVADYARRCFGRAVMCE